MLRLLRSLTVALGALACLGTALSLSKGSHWLVRMWDFPRVQIAAAAGVAAAAFRAFFFRGRGIDRGFLAANLVCLVWQLRKILPFTPVAGVQVKPSPPECPKARSFRLLIANVLMENRRHERLLALIRKCQPDLILVVETDAIWTEALS